MFVHNREVKFMTKTVFWLKLLLLIIIGLLSSTCMFWGLTDNRIISVIDLDNTNGGINISISDNKLLVAAENISIIDISNPVSPKLMGIYNTDTFYIAGADQYLYYGSFGVLDISNPALPQNVANLTLSPLNEGGPGAAFVKDGNYIYCSSFSIVDISNPLTPTEVYTTEMVPLEDIYVSGNYLFLVNDFGLTIMDATNKSNPLLLGRINNSVTNTYNNSYSRNIVVHGDTAYITNWNSRLLGIVDVSNKNNPIDQGNYTGSIANSIPTSLALENDSLYISYITDPLAIFTTLAVMDLKNPTAPKLRTEISRTTFQIKDIEITDNFLYLALENGDIIIMKKPVL